MDIELISAKTMCERMNINMETFRKTWKRWKHERVGDGHTLKSMRFYWSEGPKPEEADNGNLKISDEKGCPLAGGHLSGRRKDSKKGRIPDTQRSVIMGRRATEIDAAARRFGFA